MNQLSSAGRTLVGIHIHSDKVRIIDAVCINCNKRFKSMRAVSMHLKMTATRHTVNFINYGNYSKKTGLRELNHAVSQLFRTQNNSTPTTAAAAATLTLNTSKIL
jgi:hypothetical protein